MKNNKNGGETLGGLGFFGVLTIVFIVLKLCKVISWSWAWVLAPVWIPLTLLFIAIVIYTIVLIIKIKRKR